MTELVRVKKDLSNDLSIVILFIWGAGNPPNSGMERRWDYVWQQREN
jgi:hypothetical protein